jgi:cytochrome c oxidase subunit 2
VGERATNASDSPGRSRGRRIATGVAILFVSVYGGYGVLSTAKGARGAQDPPSLVKPRGRIEVQVVGRRWGWAYRWPGWGGVETRRLELPVGEQVAFHVTSLDVLHGFAARRLGVHADAMPGADNVVFATPSHVGAFRIRCTQLCRLGRPLMGGHAAVVGEAAFVGWIQGEQRANLRATRILPPYSHAYLPSARRKTR